MGNWIAVRATLRIGKFVRKLWEEALSAETLTVPRLREISAIAYSNAKYDCVEKIKNKYIVNSSADDWTSRRIVCLLRYAQVLCDNRLQLHEDSTIKEVVSGGFAQLEADSSNSFRIVDPLFLDALESCCRSKDVSVYEVLKYLVDTNHFVLDSETSSKGTVFEQLVACFLIKGRSFLQTYGVRINATIARTVGNISLENERKRLLGGDYYYFPRTRTGPDGWTKVSFEDVSDGTSWIGIQCMCYKKKLSFPEFKKALSSLTLTRVFGDNFVATVREKSNRYVRMVFSICGFDEHTWFMVTEYNIAYPKQPIILCSAYEISQHDEAALSLLEKVLRRMNANHPVSPDVTKWRLNGDIFIGDQRSFLHRITKKERLKRSDLEGMCRLRQISCSKMTKEKLALALFSHLKQWNNNKSTYFDGLIIYPPIPQKRCFDDK
ncbi:hypothetical protein BKA69DRAFT_35551 [Paraphysoderma sedebokerense]|nr:hypothetical protein BKA69DRAFT_35551 [Paraphysoderma sedebokerense]